MDFMSSFIGDVLRQLEHYGVTTIEKTKTNPDYWAMGSSQHQIGELNELPLPTANFLLPVAYAVDSPDFQLRYWHEFWTYFSWHQWGKNWITIQDGERDDDSIDLDDDYGWIQTKWQVRGTNITVGHTCEYALNIGSKDVHKERNYADDPEYTIHNGNERVQFVNVGRYNSSPKEGWSVTVDWTVQSING